jgi:hypothetical protein
VGKRDTVPVKHPKERFRTVVQQMPAIRNLKGTWSTAAHAVGIGAGPIARDNLNAGMLAQPRRQRARFAIRKQVNNPALLEIAQDRAVALATPPRPIIDPEHAWGLDVRPRLLIANEAQQRGSAYREAEAPGQAGTRFPAKSEAEMALHIT